jgi:hypothetical protein
MRLLAFNAAPGRTAGQRQAIVEVLGIRDQVPAAQRADRQP